MGQEMSTGQTALMRCGCVSKAGLLIPFVEACRWQVKLCGPALTRTIMSDLEVSILTNVPVIILILNLPLGAASLPGSFVTYLLT